MNFIKTSALTLSLAVAGLVSYAQTADEIIQKHITAIGGADAWKKINATKMTGSISAQGMEMPVVITTVNKKAMRMDLTIMGTSNYQIVTDKGGWSFFPIQQQAKPEPMTEDQVKESQDRLDVQGELIDYAAKGTKVEFVGKDDMEGTAVLKVKVTDKDGDEKTMYFDASSYFILREVDKVKADGQEGEVTVNYSNFKKLPEGITMPLTIETQMGPITMTDVQINPAVDESIFVVSQ